MSDSNQEQKQNLLESLGLIVTLMKGYAVLKENPLNYEYRSVLQDLINICDDVDGILEVDSQDKWEHLKEVARGSESFYDYELAIGQSDAFTHALDLALSYVHGMLALKNISKYRKVDVDENDEEDEAC